MATLKRKSRRATRLDGYDSTKYASAEQQAEHEAYLEEKAEREEAERRAGVRNSGGGAYGSYGNQRGIGINQPNITPRQSQNIGDQQRQEEIDALKVAEQERISEEDAALARGMGGMGGAQASVPAPTAPPAPSGGLKLTPGPAQPLPGEPGPEQAPQQKSDLLTDLQNRFFRDTQGHYDGLINEALGFADAYRGFADDYASELRGSEGYKGNQYLIDEMKNLYQSGGLTDVTRAQLEANRRAALQTAGAQQGYIEEDMAERGLGGGAAELSGRFAAADAAAARQQASDLDAAAFGQQSAIDALKAAGRASQTQWNYDQGIAQTQMAAKEAGLHEVYDASTAGSRDFLSTYMTGLFPGWTEENFEAVRKRREVASEGRRDTTGILAGSDGDDTVIDITGASVSGPTTGQGASTTPGDTGPGETGTNPDAALHEGAWGSHNQTVGNAASVVGAYYNPTKKKEQK